MTAPWIVERVAGPAGPLHDGSAAAVGAEPPRRTARILRAESPAVVLGSHEPEEWFDRTALERSGIALARRHSGGGAVLVGPGRTVWVDFIIPAGDPLWDDDIGRAAWWVGDLWADVLVESGVAGAGRPAVWKGAMRRTRWSPLVCFAGVGPGEVEVGGAKVVGVSQRRSRHAALFQTAALLEWDAGLWVSLLSDAGRAAAGEVTGGGGPVPPDLSGAARGLGAASEERLLSAIACRLMP